MANYICGAVHLLYFAVQSRSRVLWLTVELFVIGYDYHRHSPQHTHKHKHFSFCSNSHYTSRARRDICAKCHPNHSRPPHIIVLRGVVVFVWMRLKLFERNRQHTHTHLEHIQTSAHIYFNDIRPARVELIPWRHCERLRCVCDAVPWLRSMPFWGEPLRSMCVSCVGWLCVCGQNGKRARAKHRRKQYITHLTRVSWPQRANKRSLARSHAHTDSGLKSHPDSHMLWYSPVCMCLCV